MGSTTYFDMTARQAVEYELRGCEVLRSSGAWHVFRGASGVFMVHAITHRESDGVNVKMVTSDMGPYAVPPESLLRFFLRVLDRGLTECEAEWVKRCEAQYAQRKTVGKLPVGAVFTLRSPMSFSDGVSELSFRYGGKFLAYRVGDGRGVRLPRSFRSQIVGVSS